MYKQKIFFSGFTIIYNLFMFTVKNIRITVLLIIICLISLVLKWILSYVTEFCFCFFILEDFKDVRRKQNAAS